MSLLKVFLSRSIAAGFALFASLPAISIAAGTAPVGWTEDYGPGGSDISVQSDHDYDWLYEILMPKFERAQWPNESFKSFRVHLQDTDSFFPHPQRVEKKNLARVRDITGKITYAGIFRKPYRYTVKKSSRGLMTLEVKIYLWKATQTDQINFAKNVKLAEDLWNQYRVPMNFQYKFKFSLVEDQADADFNVEVLDSTRGPYDQYWSRTWNHFVIAHEIGHMLGLGDEYQTVSSKVDCLTRSIMCSSWSGELMPHHYYNVLRRLLVRP